MPSSASLAGCGVFPSDNAWNLDVSELPVHPDSERFIDSVGRDDHVHPDFGTEWEGAPIGIPFITVDASQPEVPIVFTAYGDESDAGPYLLPMDAPIEGGPEGDGDRHVIVIDTSDCTLHELYRAFPEGNESHADSGAVFHLTRNDEHPYTFTSADAAGLPIFPGLVRYDEGELRHAVRFTVSRTRRALIAPARHHAGAVICAGLERHGLLLADNGSDWYLSGAPDPRWDDDALGDLKQVTGDAFEVVETGAIQTY